MKNILLATTAIALTAGYAAADVSYGASAKLVYGNFTTGTTPPPAVDSYSYGSEFDFTITGSGEAGGVSYSAGMTIDEGGVDDTAAVSMSTGGFTVAYDKNDFGGLVDEGTDGEDDNAGDLKISYAGNGFSISHEMDTDPSLAAAVAGTDDINNGRYDTIMSYAANGLSVGLHISDDDGSGPNGAVNTVSVGYTMGALTISYAADDQASQDYDVKATYTMGDTVLSAGSDEIESHYVGITTSVGGLSLTARSEAEGNTTDDTAESEVSLSYTMGALTVAYATDTGNSATTAYGDEARTVTTLTYDLGGIKLEAKGNNRDQTEVSAAFSL
jgi:outer membrane protein OmpU